MWGERVEYCHCCSRFNSLLKDKELGLCKKCGKKVTFLLQSLYILMFSGIESITQFYCAHNHHISSCLYVYVWHSTRVATSITWPIHGEIKLITHHLEADFITATWGNERVKGDNTDLLRRDHVHVACTTVLCSCPRAGQTGKTWDWAVLKARFSQCD